jgi:dipeptidyl-peptidase-4
VDALPDAESPLLCSRVGWTPRGELWFTTQDRAQTWLELHRCDTALKPALLFRDATKAWVEPEVEPHYLPDGTFVWAREPEGYRHLHLHAADGKLLRALTTGEWEVRKVRRLEAGFVYFTANKDNPISEQLYRAKLDGTGMERVTDGKGDRRAADLAPGGQFVVDVFSAPDHPTRSVLCSPAGRAIRTLDANPVPERRDFDFAGPEFLKIKLADGYTLDGILVPPAKLEAGQRYPVHTKIYGGPRMPQVRQEWAGGRGDERMLAELGIATFIVDPRSASGHSAKAAWSAYRKLGQQEAKDLAEAVAWLAQQKPWIDPQRVGLEGFSYGGYLTAYCLTHTKAFAAGVAGSGPMDWRRYDSIYTERYMGLPAENRVGYDQGSVLLAAANLHGKLLVCHGMLDDNVHPENSLRLLLELQKAGKPCEAMLYPGARHENFGRHFRELRLDFLKRTLGGPRPTA